MHIAVIDTGSTGADTVQSTLFSSLYVSHPPTTPLQTDRGHCVTASYETFANPVVTPGI